MTPDTSGRNWRPPPFPDDPMSDLLSKKETAKLLNCSTRTLDRWRSMWKARNKNPLGEVKVRKCARFRREAIEKLFTTPNLWL